jgi:hypothetical protein
MYASADLITTGGPQAHSRSLSAGKDLVFVQNDDHTRFAASGIPTTTLRRRYKKLIRNPNWMSQDTNWRKYQCMVTNMGEATIAGMIYENHLTATDYSRRRKTLSLYRQLPQ